MEQISYHYPPFAGCTVIGGYSRFWMVGAPLAQWCFSFTPSTLSSNLHASTAVSQVRPLPVVRHVPPDRQHPGAHHPRERLLHLPDDLRHHYGALLLLWRGGCPRPSLAVLAAAPLTHSLPAFPAARPHLRWPSGTHALLCAHHLHGCLVPPRLCGPRLPPPLSAPCGALCGARMALHIDRE